MDESESKNEKPKEKRRFDPELLKKGLRRDLDQYDMLKRCSDKKDITEWNEWRKKNMDEDICLEGANFDGFFLVGVRLDEDPINIFGKVYLERAKFRLANLNHARFFRAHLERSDFYHANLESALMSLSHLEGAQFSRSDLRGAQLPFCIVNGSTIFLYCEINQHTWFYGVGLDSLRIDPETKQLLEYNVRLRKWEDWYTWSDWYEGCPEIERRRAWKALCWPVRAFWEISDYGISTKKIIITFFGLALIFANIYYHWARIAPPGIVDNLLVDRNGNEVQTWLVPLRTFYFSVVTMTTLGFGDMYANALSIWGHLLLTIQVILGYVLLGALVTRFAVLFTAGGPAGRFANEKKNRNKTTEKIKN